MILTVAATLCWLSGGTVREDLRILSREPLVWLLLSFLAWAVASWLWTTDTTKLYLDSLGKYRKLIFIIPFMALLMRHQDWRRPVLWALGSGLVVMVLLCLLSGIEKRSEFGVVFFKNYITQGYLCAVLMVLVIGEWVRTQSRNYRHLLTVIALMTVFLVFFLTAGRTGYVCLLTVLGCACVYFLRSPVRVLIAAVVLALGTAALVASSPMVQKRVEAGRADIVRYGRHDVNSSLGLRLEFWKASWQMFTEYPVLGVGCGSWKKHWVRIERGKGVAEPRVVGYHGKSGNPHQDYLNQLSQLGLVGFALWMGFLFCVARKLWHAAPEDRWLAVGVLGMYLVGCLFNSLTRDVTEGHVFVLMTSLLVAPYLGYGRGDGVPE